MVCTAAAAGDVAAAVGCGAPFAAADGAEADGDGQCDAGDVDLLLHANANLISFFALPQATSVINIFGS